MDDHSDINPDMWQDPEFLRQWYEDIFAGTFRSNLHYLLGACISNHVKTAEGFSNIIDARNRGLEKGISRAEALVMLELNYDIQVAGPIIGAVLTPAYALEGFAWLAGAIALFGENQDPNGLRLALHGFDRLSFIDRLDEVLTLTNSDRFEPDLKNSLLALIEFRNGTVHDTPLLQTDRGSSIRARYAKLSFFNFGSAYRGIYPVLGNSNMPLTLRHSQQAIEGYESYVSHVKSTASEDFLSKFNAMLSPELRGRLSIKDRGYRGWDKIEDVASYWETEIIPWVKSIPMGERKEYLDSLNRRKNLKVVDNDKD